ncbi:MAG TPA: aminotransferase class I/II-fold pyridoxal phosphate-dependent enzyme, partial [Candidatus Dojkabacteria bacterium]
MINLQFSTQQYKVPESFGKYLHEYLKKANTYHTQPQELIKKISEKYGINSKNLFLTAGADEAILAISNEFGEKTHIFTPTYVEYTNAERFGYKVIRENSFNNGSYEIDTNQKNASLIFLANPGNPIGETSREKIIDLIENNQQAIVVIDEVYHEYSPNLTVIDLIEKYDNLIVLRSFSKSFGMAGIRLGFAVSQEKNLKRIADKVQWANVSYLSV